jgi:PAS domain S-box-containing protein
MQSGGENSPVTSNSLGWDGRQPEAGVRSPRRVWLGYGIALTGTAALLAARALPGQLSELRPPLIMFLLPVMLGAYVSGLGPGLVSTLLGAYGTIDIGFPSHQFFSFAGHLNSERWLTFGALGIVISVLFERFHHLGAVSLSEETFRMLVSQVKDYAIFMLDAEGRVMSWNEGAECIKGYKPREIIGRHFSCFYTPEDIALEYPQEELQTAAREGRFEDEGWRVRKDGSRFWANVVLTALRDEKGELRGFSKVTRDVTARKKAEQNLRVLLYGAPDAIVAVNQEGKIVLVNPQVEKLFGYGREELLGQAMEILVPDRFRGHHAGHCTNFFAAPRVREMGAVRELYARRKDGTEFPVDISLSLLETEEGPLVSSAIRDITERKRAEEALRQSEQRLSVALESAQTGIWELNLETDTSIRSLRHDQIFGYSELQPRWGLEIFMPHVVPQDREQAQKSFEEAYKTDVLNLECRILRADDQSLRWVSAQGRLVRDPQGKPVRMYGVVADVTDRKKVEEDLLALNRDLQRKTAEFEAANKELEAFTYSVSHDLRAPLRHVDGFSKLLIDKHGAELSPDAREDVATIRESVVQMGMLIDDLLNLARLGKRQLITEATGLNSLVKEVQMELIRANPGRAIEWKIATLPFVECDPFLMKQVFVNLLSNAVKYSRPRTPAVIEVGVASQNGTRAVYVRDNGVGFSMKYAGKLFGVFQRLHRSEDFEGTGVGLATVQRIIHKHGGRIWADAALDQGATFYFALGPPDGPEAGKAGSGPISIREGEPFPDSSGPQPLGEVNSPPEWRIDPVPADHPPEPPPDSGAGRGDFWIAP